ncbi:MAG: L,D-transpeptidase family protein [Pseudomonadota bacterium]
MKHYFLGLMLSFFPFVWVTAEEIKYPHVYLASKQLVVVITEQWTSSSGVLQRYFREDEGENWHPVNEAINVVVGKNGLGWGRGLHEKQEDIDSVGPIKQEGDQRAPAGIFSLTHAFGYAPNAFSQKLFYIPLTPHIECVDDSHSAYYNQILDRSLVDQPDWKSSERMLNEALYQWGVVINHNKDQVLPGAGSCLFMHRWKAPNSPTAGCTAMAEEDLKQVINWIDNTYSPILVQLPKAEYERLRAMWKLP